MMDVKLSVSLQCAPPLAMGAAVDALWAAGVDYLHVDVMDGRFVPNIALSFDLMEAIAARGHGEQTFPAQDVHLMMEAPEAYLERAVRAGGKRVCFHWEAVLDTGRARGHLDAIRGLGAQAGLVLSPATPVEAVLGCLGHVDFVQCMGVRPGFAGQAFLPETVARVAQLAGLRREEGCAFEIEVDGGIDVPRGIACAQAGADVLVLGKCCLFGGTLPLADEVAAVRRGLAAGIREQ